MHSGSDTSIVSRVDIFRKSLSLRMPSGNTSGSGSFSGSPHKGGSHRRVTRHRLKRGRPGRSRSGDTSPHHSMSSQGFSAKLPSYLKQPIHRGIDAPVILRDDPRLHKRKTIGRRSVSDALSSIEGSKEGEPDPTYHRLIGRTIFYLRGFGCFDISWGIGTFGKTFSELIRRGGADNSADL